MNLEKRIKRHIIGRVHEFFVITLPGYEQFCADELATLSDSVRVTRVLKGGVGFYGRLTDVYLANLHVRTAGRVLMRLGRFKATNFSQLETHTQKIAWELYLPEGILPELNVSTHHSRLYHTQAVAEHLRQGIADRWLKLGIPPTLAPVKDQALFARLQNDRVTLSLDSSGTLLHRRGLKSHKALAPLRETTAVAILKMAGFRPGVPLVDPMCGSGTFSLEAALMTKNIPPGLFRDFSFQQWPAFRPQHWAHLKKIADQKIRRHVVPLIWASDSDETTCARLSDCLRRTNLADAVTVSQKDFFSIKPEQTTTAPGLVVLNPPYGERLLWQGDTQKRYRDICSKLKKDFKGWQAALLVPKMVYDRRLGLSLKSVPMDHGGIKLTLLVGKI
jgi:putative N6-adenine-specific DNA methylase